MKKQINKQKMLYYILLLISFWRSASLGIFAAANKTEIKSVEEGVDDDEFDYTYKLLLLGDGGVGKTAIYQHLNGEQFSTGYVETHMHDHKHYSVVLGGKEGEKVKASIWDTGGQEKYARLTRSAYHNTHCIILCYDLTKEESFISCKDRWQDEIENYCNLAPCMILCGTKADLSNKRMINVERAEKLQTHFESLDFIKSVMHLETSAKKGYQVNKLIEAALQCLINCEPRQYGDQTLKSGDKVIFSDTSNYPNQKGTVKITYPTCFEVILDKQPGTTVVVNSKKMNQGIIKSVNSEDEPLSSDGQPVDLAKSQNPANTDKKWCCGY